MHGEHGLAVNGRPHQGFVRVEGGQNLQAVAAKTLVGEQRFAQMPRAHEHRVVRAVAAQKVLQALDELLRIVSHARLAAGNKGEILAHLDGRKVHVLRDGGGRSRQQPFRALAAQVIQVFWQPLQRGARNCPEGVLILHWDHLPCVVRGRSVSASAPRIRPYYINKYLSIK